MDRDSCLNSDWRLGAWTGTCNSRTQTWTELGTQSLRTGMHLWMKAALGTFSSKALLGMSTEGMTFSAFLFQVGWPHLCSMNINHKQSAVFNKEWQLYSSETILDFILPTAFLGL
jgi:hypothetical protein